MSWRTIFCSLAMFLGAALYLAGGPATAGGGDRYHATRLNGGNRPPVATAPARPTYPAPVVASRVSVPVVTVVYNASPARPTNAEDLGVYVDVREPDGTVRTYPVEGGREAAQSRSVIVRPGESVTVHFLAAAPKK